MWGPEHFRRSVLGVSLLLGLIAMLTGGVRSAGSQTRGVPPTASMPGSVNDDAILLKSTDLAQFDPPSPDPAGITYWPGTRSLLISDSEVNELAQYFTGDNVFQSSLGGELLDTLTTLPSSDEPTGIAVNPSNDFLYVTDDAGARGFYVFDPGPDGEHNTPDDASRFVDTNAFGARDPEDVAFDSLNGYLFLVSGADAGTLEAIYRIDPGANGIFDGEAPAGDDIVTVFESLPLGIRDPEGLTFNPDNGNLFVLSGRDELVAEVTTDGNLIRYIDVSSLNALNLSGVAYAPASDEPSTRSLYLVARGVDNAIDPDENDGMLYEVSFPLNIDNLSPFADAGSDQFVDVGQDVIVQGIASDDGNPDPPGAVTTVWSQKEGPATATFADETALQTTVSFSEPGVYVLRLTADDGQLSAFDEATIVVIPPLSHYLPFISFDLPAGNN